MNLKTKNTFVLVLTVILIFVDKIISTFILITFIRNLIYINDRRTPITQWCVLYRWKLNYSLTVFEKCVLVNMMDLRIITNIALMVLLNCTVVPEISQAYRSQY